ncbi:hypothetical protein [Actinospica robiniae]|uniref:hypothetical protein n=1 Tax=Actinospica robiniae TaxID=304901 RepID=UPI0009FFB227|nr:hypothetical protein [Actinospica robiniae]
MDTLATPPARPAYESTARRIGWDGLPAGVRAVISARVGGQARAEASAGCGFTSGFAARVRGRGGCWFVKAAGAREAPFAAESYVIEARINSLLPAGVPAPRLRWTERTDAAADGHDATALLARHPAAAGADPEQVDSVLAGIAGFFVGRCIQPEDALSPSLRMHQRYSAHTMLSWLAERRADLKAA